jgi:hypothetical protein
MCPAECNKQNSSGSEANKKIVCTIYLLLICCGNYQLSGDLILLWSLNRKIFRSPSSGVGNFIGIWEWYHWSSNNLFFCLSGKQCKPVSRMHCLCCNNVEIHVHYNSYSYGIFLSFMMNGLIIPPFLCHVRTFNLFIVNFVFIQQFTSNASSLICNQGEYAIIKVSTYV